MYTLMITTFAFFLAIFILVAFHEYGHFIVARLCNVKVLKFCVGFGPAIFKKKDKYNTEFVLAPIPLGGFVKMLDEREGKVATHELMYEFNNKKPLQKIAIVAAGPIFNFILAFIVFYFMFMQGIVVERPVIQYVEPGSLAEKSGIQSDTEIIKIGDLNVSSFSDVQVALSGYIGTTNEVNITTKKFVSSKDKLKLNIVPNNTTSKLNIKNWKVDINNEPLARNLGIWLLPKDSSALKIENILPDTNADISSLKIGDVIISYNNKKIEQWDSFLTYIQDHPKQDLKLTVDRNGASLDLLVKTGYKQDSTQAELIGYLGIAFKYPLYTKMQSYGFIDSIYKAADRTIQYINQTFYMIYKLIVGELGMDTVRGPVMVAKVAGMQMRMGISNFLNFLGVVSIGLGVINLLPIPVLDGGHLVYHLYELVTGKQVSLATEKVSIVLGLFFLAFIMGVAFYNDYIYW